MQQVGLLKKTGLGLGVLALAAFAATGCDSDDDGGSSAYAGLSLSAENPFEGFGLYVYPGTQAARAAAALESSSPDDAALAAKIASQPAAEWFDQPVAEMGLAVDSYVTEAASEGSLPVLVAYNIPARDCGQYSAGGVADAGLYREWIDVFTQSIGERPAIVVLEPDALPLIEQCLSEEDQDQRLELFEYAVQGLSALPNAAVYIDAGHSSWISVEDMAARLRGAGIEQVRGFSLNVSNYQRDEDLVSFGQRLIAELDLDVHFVIDSSRNGNGPEAGPEGWCNPEGRALGRVPGAVTDVDGLDAYLWIKRPGESDGQCRGGPAPGLWFPERAFELARNASW
ncbi:MAG: glycoside hydrolase family 6 protein [Myxococcales bacterium]|nr:glycoside hydrolase family 6 protein [Myxococcales bacterium]